MNILIGMETRCAPRVYGELGGSGWDVRWDMVMGRRGQKFLVHFAFSAIAAVVTPAMAAGLVAGTSAGTEAIGSAVYPAEDPAGPAINGDSSPFVATHGPAKLSVLVGNDKAAWDSAHSVHVDFRRHPKS